MNKILLRYYMALNGDTNRKLADFLDLSLQSLSAKINENGSQFKQGEIAKIKERYKLTAEEIENIFFA